MHHFRYQLETKCSPAVQKILFRGGKSHYEAAIALPLCLARISAQQSGQGFSCAHCVSGPSLALWQREIPQLRRNSLVWNCLIPAVNQVRTTVGKYQAGWKLHGRLGEPGWWVLAMVEGAAVPVQRDSLGAVILAGVTTCGPCSNTAASINFWYHSARKASQGDVFVLCFCQFVCLCLKTGASLNLSQLQMG